MGDNNVSKEFLAIMLASYKTMIKGTKDMIFIKDINHVYVDASEAFIRMVGKRHISQVVGYTDFEIFEDESLAKRYVDDDNKLLERGIDLVDYVEPITDDDGHARYASTSKYILRDSDGNVIGIFGVSRDVTREYYARQNYQQELKSLFKLPEEAYAVCYIDIDDWRIISQRRKEMFEGTLQSCNIVEEVSLAAVDSIIDRDSKAFDFYKDFSKDSLEQLFKSGTTELSFKYQRKLTNGLVRWIHNKIKFITDVESGHLCVMLTAKDIDEEKKAEEEILIAAKMDKMTMVLNRETTMKRIREILSGYKDETHVLFMLDVDNFKMLNDTYGHQTGDRFLVRLADELKGLFRETDVVGRIGGDEFFALMKNVPDISAVKGKAVQILETIVSICDEYEGINLSGSIGLSIYPEHGTTVEQLYAKADEALYQAKRQGKNQFIFTTS